MVFLDQLLCFEILESVLVATNRLNSKYKQFL